jgi:hypothetical protein
MTVHAMTIINYAKEKKTTIVFVLMKIRKNVRVNFMHVFVNVI